MLITSSPSGFSPLAMSDNNFDCHDLEKGKATSKHKIMPYRVSL